MSLRLSSTAPSKDSLSQGLMSACLTLEGSAFCCISRSAEDILPIEKEYRMYKNIKEELQKAPQVREHATTGQVVPCLPGRITVEKLAWVPKWSIVWALQYFPVVIHVRLCE